MTNLVIGWISYIKGIFDNIPRWWHFDCLRTVRMWKLLGKVKTSSEMLKKKRFKLSIENADDGIIPKITKYKKSKS